MADISFIRKADPEDTDEAMEAEDDEEVNDNLGTEVWAGVGRGGDESGWEQHSQLTRLQEYATSDATFSRQMVGRILVEIFRAAVNNGTKLNVNDVMQHVQQIVDDPEAQVRADLVEQLPHAAMVCQKGPHLFGDVLRQHLLGIIIKYLRDTDSQVRQAAQTALLTLMKRGLLDNNTIEAEVCPVVEFLSYMSVEYLNSGISLMSKMAPLIGRELTEKVFLDRYIELCEDNTFYVRKICATYFGEICAAVGRKALFRRLFPTFVDLCCDRVWGVRKACVDVMMPVSCCLTLQYRRVLLAEILATHLNDDSKWVRMSAFQILGPFISTFAKQFTEVTYNQHGELVFTCQQDNHFSIRYSYESIFPTKCVIRSQMFDTEDFYLKDTLHSTVIIQEPVNEVDANCALKEEEAEAERIHIRLKEAYKSKIQKKHLENEEDDVDKYNPFLYYYIPPDLPLDDELVQAAKKSADSASENSTNKEEKDDKRSANNPESDSVEQSSSQSTVESKESTASTRGHTDDKREEENDGTYLTTHNEAPLLNDTIDVSNLSMDKSGLGTNLMTNKQPETKEGGGQDIVPQDLVDYFVSMADPEQCADMGAEIPHHCAFSFPAVALTLGRENWPYLKKAYQSLAGAKQWKVRRTLASSIHEIAIILGEELTATDLVPIYDGFIKDLDEVRIGVLKHLATFLKILKPADRCQYLPRLHDFLATDNEWNWRFREELATQLLEAVNLFSPSDVAKHIAPLSIQLLTDKVAAVRQVALSLVAQIVSHLSIDGYLGHCLVRALMKELRDTLSRNRKWICRQTYALLCAHLISSGAITRERFSKEMLQSLVDLAWDRVPNVRLAVARTLTKHVTTMGNCLNTRLAEEVEKGLIQLRMDPDRDVRVFAGGELHPQTKPEQTKNILF